MLAPNERALLTEALRPPPDHVFDRAVAMTYSLDLVTLLGIPLHLAQIASLDKREILRDGVALLEAMRRVTRKLTVFCQEGHIAIPAQDQVLFSQLETVVVGVRAKKKGGVFHPKVWVLRYKPAREGDPVVLRLLVLSRNLTADRSWDVSLVLDGQIGTQPKAKNRPLVDLLLALPDLAVRKVPELTVEGVKQLAEEVRYADWQLPGGFDSVHFHTLGLNNQRWLPPASRRLVVISPFVTENALRELAGTTEEPVALITRAEELDALPGHGESSFARRLVLHEEAETEEGEDPAEQSERLYGLHAKVYIARVGWDTHVILGSANATSAALLNGQNVEFLVELAGKSSATLQIDDLFKDEHLGQLLTEYRAPDGVATLDPGQAAAEAALETARAALTDAGLHLRCEGEGDSWKLVLSTVAPIAMPGVSRVRVWQVSMPEPTGGDAPGLLTGQPTELPPCALASLTGLLAFELQAQDRPERLRFVLNLPVEGLPDTRDAALYRTIVSNRESFVRWILLLLGEPDMGAGLPLGTGSGAWTNGHFGADDSVPLLEELTRAFCRPDGDEERAQRWNSIRTLVDELLKIPEGEQVLPPDFLPVWRTFQSALEVS
jgi:hypothetical protein